MDSEGRAYRAGFMGLLVLGAILTIGVPDPSDAAAGAAIGKIVQVGYFTNRARRVTHLADGADYLISEKRAADYYSDMGIQMSITKKNINEPGPDIWHVADNGVIVGFDVKELAKGGPGSINSHLRDARSKGADRIIMDARGNAAINHANATKELIRQTRFDNGARFRGVEEVRIITDQGEVVWIR